MADPYVYTYRPFPGADDPSSSYSPYSPFIPNNPLYSSPYTDTIPLPDSPPITTTLDGSTPNTPLNRPRRGSWHAEYPFYGQTLYTPPSPYFLPLPEMPDALHTRRRRHSFSLYPGPTISTWDPYSNPPVSPAQFHLHPWLDAQNWTGEFSLNLSDPSFKPMQVYSISAGRKTRGPARVDVLSEPATDPPLTRLRIVCDILPQWPIDLRHPLDQGTDATFAFDSARTSGRLPITVRDILFKIYESLQTRITHQDWARLNSQAESMVTKAYRKRCKAVGSTGVIGSTAAVEAALAQGVKRVDFLLGKVWFKGCIMDWERGVMRLII
ncbi:hypothetical protein K435DRAFT_133195 [Dendrothele bispora CBS 962.96]|uniref:DUF6699 domain-containing protein n=1 Tax=Dendrothele bispora (strain CBS 962.96) TaxID=1314807 RepID=A0A4V4HFK3_DENBC|nr:hypothetical protein K435DRAFT_133195 [Dendrothele bispora CBS 962.96]